MSERDELVEPTLPFDELAELYDRFVRVMDSERNPVRVFLREHLAGGERLLDVGCGIGQNCLWLAELYREVIGVDVSGRMVEIARSRPHPPNVRFLQQDAWELDPGADGRFDGLLVVNTAFHLGATSRVLDHFRQLLAPGGIFVVVDVVRPDDAPLPQPAREESGMSDEQRRTIFDTARAVHEMSGDIHAAIDSIRLMSHPRWLEMSAALVPMSRSEFQSTYADRLPGVVFTDKIVSELAMAVWRAPSESAGAASRERSQS